MFSRSSVPSDPPQDRRRSSSSSSNVRDFSNQRQGDSSGEEAENDASSSKPSTFLHPPSSRTIPLAAAAISPRNPFYERERNNFPDFEIALKPGSPSNVNTFDDDEHHDDDDDDDDNHQQGSMIDHSVCSGGTSSILNMSIGARAALNEHLRHVAKYGIDGEKESTGTSDKTGHEDQEGISSASGEHHHKNILDEHWENLLDVSSCRVNSSGEAGSFLGGGAPAVSSLFGDTSPLNNVMYATSAEADGDGIEVMTDVSNDYFNSSRVNLLTTPERNQSRRLDMVVTRGDGEPVGELPFGGDSFVHEEPSSFEALEPGNRSHDFLSSAFPNLQNLGASDASEQIIAEEHCNDTTVHSFNHGDISEVRGSPDTSFLSQQHHFDLDVSAIMPGADTVEASPFQTRDTSFLSAPMEREAQNRNTNAEVLQKSFPLASPSAISRRRSPRRSARTLTTGATQQKENVSPEVSSSASNSKNTGSSLQSAVSSFFEEAKSMAAYVANELEQSFGGLETLPTDFLRAMDISGAGMRNDPPSPISQVESNNSSSQESAKRKGKNGPEVHRAVLVKNDIALTGRQRFRTVVPRRIYQSSAHDCSEEEQDSFLAVRSNPETRRNPNDISLLDSFDVAATRTTF